MSPRAGLDQKSVIMAAADLVDQEGLDQLTLARLAAHLGIRTPSLYNHINGLPGLRRDLTLMSMHELLDCFQKSAIGKAGDEAVVSLAHAYRSYAKSHPERYILTQQSPPDNDRELQSLSHQLVEVTQAVLAHYKLEEKASINAVRGLRSIVQGFVSLETMGGFGLPQSIDESYNWLLKVFLDGIKQPPAR